jgi:hypothetical protein
MQELELDESREKEMKSIGVKGYGGGRFLKSSWHSASSIN